MTATELFGNFSVDCDNSMLRVLPSNLLRQEALTFHSVTDMTAKTVCDTFYHLTRDECSLSEMPQLTPNNPKINTKLPISPLEHHQKSFSPDWQ